MAFLAFNEPGMAGIARATVTATVPLCRPAVEQVDRPALTDLERSVIAIARIDRVSTLRKPGRLARWIGLVFGLRTSPQLADARLEALRRIAVLSWRHGYAVPAVELRAFLASGYSCTHYELIVDTINDARIGQHGRVAFA